jgi:hypothetical protein
MLLKNTSQSKHMSNQIKSQPSLELCSKKCNGSTQAESLKGRFDPGEDEATEQHFEHSYKFRSVSLNFRTVGIPQIIGQSRV